MNLSSFYGQEEVLNYHPQTYLKREGFKRLIAFDDRFEQVKKELENMIKLMPYPSKILDIGVGDAVYESLLDKNLIQSCEFYGVDISKKQLARAKKYLKEIKIIDLNSQKLPYSDNFFEIVIASEILEHVFYPERVLSEAMRVLKKGGYLVITFPNSSALQLRLAIFLKGRSPLLNYPQNKEHIRFFTFSDIQSMIKVKYELAKFMGLGSFVFDKWNFFFKLPIPRFL